MRNIESYRPNKKVANTKVRGFSIASKKATSKFNIKHDPKVIFRAVIYSLTSTILLGLMIFSSYHIIRWKVESDLTNELITSIQNNNKIEEISSDEDDPAGENTNTSTIKPDDPYWNLLKQNLISVDLANLKNTNSDVVGWIQVPGANIDYPFVQTTNNDFYLNHSIDRSWNDAGWVFLDYRNSSTLEDKNQIIYAHGRIDGSMFGSLQNTLSDDWKNNVDNHVVKISTEKSSSLWQVFSVYRIPKTNDYITTEFGNDNSFKTYLDLIQNRSAYDFNTNVTVGDRIITLSTCIGFNDRIVLHAKLIKLTSK